MSYIRKVIEHYTGVIKGDKCCCPIHGETTPSLHIYDDTNSWFCYGECSFGGDAIEFVKQLEGVDFPEALDITCNILGVTKEELMESKNEEREVVVEEGH